MTENTNSKKSFEDRAKAEPTQLHRDYADWLFYKTGVKVDLKAVQIACIFRAEFQKSPENQKALADRKAKAAADKKASAERKKAKLLAELAKLNGAVIENAPVAATEEVVEEEIEAPVAPIDPVKLTVAYGDGDPEVHQFGCADLKKMTRAKGFRKETATLSSHTALTHLIYPDQAAEDFDGCYMAYDIKPCCPSLDS